MTQRELDRLCRVWQRRLRLSDWNLTVHLVTEEDMPDEYGTTDPIEPGEMRAVVRVRNFEEAEATLVHELLHLRLLPFDGDDHEAQETAINLLADCYLRAFPRRRNVRQS